MWLHNVHILRGQWAGDTFEAGMARKAFVILISSLIAVCGLALEVKEGTSQRGGRELVVENALVRYRFWEENGVLASSYLYFSPYGTKPLEAVPGWTGDKEPALLRDVSLPLEIWVGDAQPKEPIEYGISYSESHPEAVEVVLSGNVGGLEVEKKCLIADKALYTVPIELRFAGNAEGVVLILGYLPTGDKAPRLVYLYDGEPHRNPLAAGSYTEFQGLGLVSRGAVFFWKLEGAKGIKPFVGKNAFGQPVFGLELPPISGELSLKLELYAGRNRYILLEKAGIAGIVKLGTFSRFLVGVIKFLEALYRATGNYGWAIILFTLTAQVLLFPLTRAQIRSMAKLQRLQPKIQKLQKLYKDDKEALQKHLVELYRQERVNPLGGCFPLLLQFPFLILLWQAIFNSAELFHISPPFLWIPDLSLPDPYYIIIVLTVGVQLLGQWLTVRRTGAQATGGTQLIGWFFPLFFAFMFRNFPAGLWLYWFLYSSIQSILQAIVYWELSRARPSPTAASDTPNDG